MIPNAYQMMATLYWSASTCPSFQSYNVYRSGTLGGDYIQIAAGLTQNSFVDQPDWVADGWFYKISVVSDFGEGLLSEEFAAPAPSLLAAPVSLLAIVPDGCQGVTPSSLGTGFDVGGFDVQPFQ